MQQETNTLELFKKQIQEAIQFCERYKNTKHEDEMVFEAITQLINRFNLAYKEKPEWLRTKVTYYQRRQEMREVIRNILEGSRYYAQFLMLNKQALNITSIAEIQIMYLEKFLEQTQELPEKLNIKQ